MNFSSKANTIEMSHEAPAVKPPAKASSKSLAKDFASQLTGFLKALEVQIEYEEERCWVARTGSTTQKVAETRLADLYALRASAELAKETYVGSRKQ